MLQDILKQKFLEQIQTQKLAEEQRQADMQRAVQERQLGQGDRRIGLDERQLTQQGEQFGQRLGLDTRKQDTEESQYAEGAPMRAATLRHVGAQTSDIERRPEAEQLARDFTTKRDQTQHGYQLGELGAQQAGQMRLANLRMAAAQGAQGAGPSPQEQQQNEVKDTLGLIDRLASDKALPAAVGPFDSWATTGMGSGILGSATAAAHGSSMADVNRFKAAQDQLLGKLQLASAGKLKGQGAVSEMERKILRDAVTSLSASTSEKEYKAELGRLRPQLERLLPGGAPAATGGGQQVAQEFDFVPGKGLVPRK
jgi:hypothetical protein